MNEIETRVCKVCVEDKPVTDFSWRSKADGIRFTTCKGCQAIQRAKVKNSNEIVMEGNKVCTYCKQDLPVTRFTPNLRYKGGREHQCIKCRADKKGREAMTGYSHKHKMKATYNITSGEFEALFALQGEVCALCGEPESMTGKVTNKTNNLCVDHDHNCCDGYFSCGKCIRGLLCHKCNRAIGLLGESLEMAKKYVAYLESPHIDFTAIISSDTH